MTKAHKQPDNKLTDFFRMIAAEANHFPVEVIEITGKNGVQGVVALDANLPATGKTKLRQLVESLSHQTNLPSIALLDKQTGLPGKAGFISQAEAEIDRVRKSRLPCSLLLIQLPGKSDLKKASTLIKKETGHYLARFDRNTLALLIPGANKNRAIKKARTIHQALSADSVTIGLAICLARNIITTDDLLRMASEQLQRAQKEGAGVFHASGELAEDSCQVTAEERAHLFSFLNKAAFSGA